MKKIGKLRGGHAIFKWCFPNPTSAPSLVKNERSPMSSNLHDACVPEQKRNNNQIQPIYNIKPKIVCMFDVCLSNLPLLRKRKRIVIYKIIQYVCSHVKRF